MGSIRFSAASSESLIEVQPTIKDTALSLIRTEIDDLERM